jgi:hypothetical protein
MYHPQRECVCMYHPQCVYVFFQLMPSLSYVCARSGKRRKSVCVYVCACVYMCVHVSPPVCMCVVCVCVYACITPSECACVYVCHLPVDSFFVVCLCKVRKMQEKCADVVVCCVCCVCMHVSPPVCECITPVCVCVLCVSCACMYHPQCVYVFVCVLCVHVSPPVNVHVCVSSSS